MDKQTRNFLIKTFIIQALVVALGVIVIITVVPSLVH
jgi:hypothetical protein